MTILNEDLYNSIYWKNKGFISWKGKTFVQLTTSIQKNKGIKSISDNNISSLFKANPLKLYRREIVSNTINSCNQRTSVRIDELNRPNGYLIYKEKNNTGINNVLDIQLTTNSYQLSTPSCSTENNCLSQEMNALRRVRSAGMNTKKYNSCTNSDEYNTNTSQYLKSRNKSFDKNQFVYKNSITPTYYKPSNQKFSQDGGVDSGSHINRLKYDTLSGVGSTLPTPKGNIIKNSLAYAVPMEQYIKKGNPFPIENKKLLKKCIITQCVPK